MLRSVAYFALVFGAGFLLGPIRVLWLVPRVGERVAELIEMPVMLMVIVCSARWLVRRFPTDRAAAWLVSGILALLLVLIAESIAVFAFRGVTIPEYITNRDPVSGVAYLCTLLAFALMPWLMARK